MNSDYFFWQGYDHDVCEDYIDSGDNYVIVSDGCSSSEKTDFGSRILVECAKQNFDVFLSPTLFSNKVINQAANISKQLKLPKESLDATLLVALIVDDIIRVHCWGDGVIAVRQNDKLTVYDISFPQSAPPYLAYALDEDNWNAYCKFTDNKIYIKTTVIGSVISESSFEEKETNGFEDFSFNINDISYIALMSDGVKSFIKNRDDSHIQEDIHTNDIVKRLLNFKNMNGEFVKRRTKRFIKECNELGIKNYDDVSIGVINAGIR